MGLMDRASTALSQNESKTEKKKTGLLERISYASVYDSLAGIFRDWLEVNRADRGGLLCSQADSDWFLLFAAGFDLTTVNRFSPQSSFMGPYIESPAMLSISGGSLDPFKPFLSSREADALKALHISYLGTVKDIRVCAVVADSLLSVYRNSSPRSARVSGDIERLWAGVKSSVDILPLLMPDPFADQGSVEEKTRSLLASGMKTVLFSISLEQALGTKERIATEPQTSEIYRAIVKRIRKKAGPSNIVRVCDDFSLRIVLFTSQYIDFDMYIRQLLAPLEKAFGIPRISRVEIIPGGRSDSIQEISAYARGRV